MLLRPPFFYRKLYSQAIWKYNGTKTIYLTFDDGPNPKVTSWVLGILKSYNAKATFFCVGKNIEKFPESYKEILEEGHATGNHTFSHCDGWKTNSNRYLDDAKRCASFVKGQLFRPPYGRLRPAQYRELLKQKYKIVMWDVLAGDFLKFSNQKKHLDTIINDTSEGSIVVFHDSEKCKTNLEYLLPHYLEHFSSKGYHFSHL